MKFDFLKHLVAISVSALISLQSRAAGNVTVPAQARGPGSSGGGNAVVCFKTPSPVEMTRRNGGYIPNSVLNQIVFIETLDLYQAKKPRGVLEGSEPKLNSIIPIADDESIYQYAVRIFKRIQFFFPDFYNELISELAKTDGQNVIHMDDRIEPVFDIRSEREADPLKSTKDGLRARAVIMDTARPNCVLATIARQSLHGEMTKFEIDVRLFQHPKNSRLSRAVLLIHEIGYSVARRLLRHSSSEAITFFTGALLTQNLNILDFFASFDSLFSEIADQKDISLNRQLKSMKNSPFAAAIVSAFQSQLFDYNYEPIYSAPSKILQPQLVVAETIISKSRINPETVKSRQNCRNYYSQFEKRDPSNARFLKIEAYLKNPQALRGLERTIGFPNLNWAKVFESAQYTFVHVIDCPGGELFPIPIPIWPTEDSINLYVAPYEVLEALVKAVGKQAQLPVYQYESGSTSTSR